MAIGFTPKYQQEFPLNNLDIAQFLVIIDESVQFLKWERNYISKESFSISTSKKLFGTNYLVNVKINNGIAVISSESTGNEMIDFGKNKKNVLDLISQIEFQQLILKPYQIEEKYEALVPEIIVSEEQLELIAGVEKPAEFKDILTFFIPKQGFFIVPILIDLNILIFVAMLISGANIINPSQEILINWGANLRQLTANGQLWRVITSNFIHIGILHLVMNMFALAYIGSLLEPIIGRFRLSTAYLFSGILAGITSAWWHDATISAGASGAIFGLFGTFLGLLMANILDKSTRKSLFMSIGLFVAYNLIYGLKGGIDNSAHIGGLIMGFLIGIAYIPGLKNDSRLIRFVTVGAISIYVVVIMFVAKYTLPKNTTTNYGISHNEKANGDLTPDEIKYNTLITEFISMDQMALNIFPIDTTEIGKEKSLSDIRDIGIYYYKRNLEILDNIDSLNLNADTKTKNLLMRKYCKQSITMYQLMYKAVEEHTKAYDKEINKHWAELNNIKQQASKISL